MLHFDKALLELRANEPQGCECLKHRAGWRSDSAWSARSLRGLQRPEVFNCINATRSVQELADLITRGRSAYPRFIIELPPQSCRLEVSFFHTFADPAMGLKKLHFTVAFIRAATKISMENNYQRFSPDLDGLKLFVYVGIHGRAGVTPSPHMTTWWPDIASLWPH